MYTPLEPCIYIRKTHFPYVKMPIFYTYVAKIGNSVLTKRSTLVDQNFRSCKGVSKLSLATFIAPQTHFWAQESLIYEKMSLKIAFFDPYGAQKGISVLTKRSTHVDQNLISWKVMSKLSVAIFIAPRTHFPAQKSLIFWKKSEKPQNPCKTPPWSA